MPVLSHGRSAQTESSEVELGILANATFTNASSPIPPPKSSSPYEPPVLPPRVPAATATGGFNGWHDSR